MTQEQADSIIGRIIREVADAKRTRNLLFVEARRVEDLLLGVAKDLRTNPQTITLERMKEVEADRIIRLASDIQDAGKKLSDLLDQATSLGVKDIYTM